MKKNSDMYPRIYKTGIECKQLLYETLTKMPSDFIVPEMPEDTKKALKHYDEKCYIITPIIATQIEGQTYILEIKKDSYFINYKSRLRLTPQLTHLLRHFGDMLTVMTPYQQHEYYRYQHSSKGTSTKADGIYYPDKRVYWGTFEEMKFTLPIVMFPRIFIIDIAGIHPDNARVDMSHLGQPPNIRQYYENENREHLKQFGTPEEKQKRNIDPNDKGTLPDIKKYYEDLDREYQEYRDNTWERRWAIQDGTTLEK